MDSWAEFIAKMVNYDMKPSTAYPTGHHGRFDGWLYTSESGYLIYMKQRRKLSDEQKQLGAYCCSFDPLEDRN